MYRLLNVGSALVIVATLSSATFAHQVDRQRAWAANVVVPLKPDHSWDTHKDFARRFAEALSMAEPDRFVATMSKAKRKGKIFIDWLRNQRGATSVLPYSARARSGAPVAVPVAWGELRDMADATQFAIGDADKLHRRARGKALSGWGFAEQSLPDL